MTSGQYLNIDDRSRRPPRATASASATCRTSIEHAIGETTLTHDDRRAPALSGPRALRAERIAPIRRRSATVLVAGAGRRAGAARPGRAHRAARGPAMISSENGLLLATVLLNVQGRDVGGFVDEAKRGRRRARCTLPAGYYLEWSGRYENQERARAAAAARACPIVLVVIFVLLYFTYHSRARGGARAAGGAVRADRRRLSALGCSATTSRSPSGSASSRCSARPCRPAS